MTGHTISTGVKHKKTLYFFVLTSISFKEFPFFEKDMIGGSLKISLSVVVLLSLRLYRVSRSPWVLQEFCNCFGRQFGFCLPVFYSSCPRQQWYLSAFLRFISVFCFNSFNAFCSLRDKLRLDFVILIPASCN